MIKIIMLLFPILLLGCSGKMVAISSDQDETIIINYNDGFGTREVAATSSDGETFNGTLIWIKDLGSSGRYKGVLLGDKGSTLDVLLECNTFTTKCVGIAKTESGNTYYIR